MPSSQTFVPTTQATVNTFVPHSTDPTPAFHPVVPLVPTTTVNTQSTTWNQGATTVVPTTQGATTVVPTTQGATTTTPIQGSTTVTPTQGTTTNNQGTTQGTSVRSNSLTTDTTPRTA